MPHVIVYGTKRLYVWDTAKANVTGTGAHWIESDEYGPKYPAGPTTIDLFATEARRYVIGDAQRLALAVLAGDADAARILADMVLLGEADCVCDSVERMKAPEDVVGTTPANAGEEVSQEEWDSWLDSMDAPAGAMGDD